MFCIYKGQSLGSKMAHAASHVVLLNADENDPQKIDVTNENTLNGSRNCTSTNHVAVD